MLAGFVLNFLVPETKCSLGVNEFSFVAMIGTGLGTLGNLMLGPLGVTGSWYRVPGAARRFIRMPGAPLANWAS